MLVEPIIPKIMLTYLAQSKLTCIQGKTKKNEHRCSCTIIFS